VKHPSEPDTAELRETLSAANSIIGQQADEMKLLQDRLDALLRAIEDGELGEGWAFNMADALCQDKIRAFR
jgi:hypothetical protein